MQETQPSHFDKGTYDFWGNNQAKLMDALVFKKDTPEAAAAAEAVAAWEAAAEGGGTAAAAAAEPAAEAAAGGDKAAGEAAQQQENGEQQPAAEAPPEPPHDPAHKATHVLIARDPSGRILTVPYEYGKNHRTHGPNRKLWVIQLMGQLGLAQGDLLVATKEPFEFKPLAVRQAEAAAREARAREQAAAGVVVVPQPEGPWTKVLDR